MKDRMTMVCCPFLLFTHFFMLKGFFVFFIVSAFIEIPPYPSFLDKREPFPGSLSFQKIMLVV